MERNPYSPPQSPVEDVEPAPSEYPRGVSLACKLIWFSFGLRIVSAVTDVLSLSGVAQVFGGAIGALIGAAIGYAITRWFVSKLKSGRNWVRLIITVGSVAGYLSIAVFWDWYVANVFPVYAGSPMKAIVAVLGIIPNVWTIILLNMPRSSVWFAANKSRAMRAA